MNQILYTGKGKGKGPASIKSIIRFFSIALIILGTIFVGQGSYALYTNYIASNLELDNTVPEVIFEQEGNNAIITISHNKGISKIKYHWNEDTDTIIQGGSETTVILDDISILSGTNTLYVTAIDVNGKANETSYDYSYDGICIEFPAIIKGSNSIKIVASDVTGLSYITYKWNSGEEIKAYPNSEDTTIIEQTTEIPSGLNTLTVTAVNSSNYTLTKSIDIKGVHPPEVSFYIDGQDLVVNVTDEEGIDTIVQQVNLGEEKLIEVGGVTEYSYRHHVGTEDILVILTVTDVEGVEKVLKGKNY